MPPFTRDAKRMKVFWFFFPKKNSACSSADHDQTEERGGEEGDYSGLGNADVARAPAGRATSARAAMRLSERIGTSSSGGRLMVAGFAEGSQPMRHLKKWAPGGKERFEEFEQLVRTA